jgi:TPR repeat protein
MSEMSQAHSALLSSCGVFQQPDLSMIEWLHDHPTAKVFHVKRSGEPLLVREMLDLHQPYQLKREKDLLQFFNRYPADFPRFQEIRKVGRHYLQFFERVGQQTLAQRLEKKGSLKTKQARRLLKNLISTLQTVHEAGFVHTRIKPENILCGIKTVKRAKRYYLANWSQAIPARKGFETELLLGEQSYTAPERLNGQYEASSDLYELGCVLYFALTGQHIYGLNGDETVFEQLYAHAYRQPLQLKRLPKDWRELIVWLTQKDPQKRPGLVDLADWLQGGSVPKAIKKQTKQMKREQKSDKIKPLPEDPLTELADAHFAYAQFKKANLLEAKGDQASAYNLYESLANQGYNRALCAQARMLAKGQGVDAHLIEAVGLYEKAYQQGNPYAAHELARLVDEGARGTDAEGVAKRLRTDHTKAEQLYEFAALRGHLPSQYALGICYLKGHGVAPNLTKAKSWLHLAASYGHASARRVLKKLVSSQE